MADTNNLYFFFIAQRRYLVSHVAFSSQWSEMEPCRDCSLKYAGEKSEQHNSEKSICVLLVKVYHKTTGCCLSGSLDESLIISSFQLKGSFWTPCRAFRL